MRARDCASQHSIYCMLRDSLKSLGNRCLASATGLRSGRGRVARRVGRRQHPEAGRYKCYLVRFLEFARNFGLALAPQTNGSASSTPWLREGHARATNSWQRRIPCFSAKVLLNFADMLTIPRQSLTSRPNMCARPRLKVRTRIGFEISNPSINESAQRPHQHLSTAHGRSILIRLLLDCFWPTLTERWGTGSVAFTTFAIGYGSLDARTVGLHALLNTWMTCIAMI